MGLQVYRNLSKEDRFKMAEQLHNNGYSCRRIARELGISGPGIVSKHLREKGHEIVARVGNSAYNRQALFEKLEAIWLKRQGIIKALCKEYHTTPASFTTYLRSKGHKVKPHRNPANKKLKTQKLSQAEALFLNGMTVSEAARSAQINNAVFSDYLKTQGHDTSKSWRIFLGDPDIFQDIDTEEKAYWLGFLYADGSITCDGVRYALELGLKESDYEHLVKFKKFLKTDAPISKRIVKGKNGKLHVSYRISVFNKTLVGDLVQKGCLPAKSLILSFPGTDIVPKKLICHFIRGYFDGDGTLYLPKKATNGYPQAHFSLIGTELFLEGVLRELNLSITKLIPQGKAWRLSKGGNHKVGDLLKQIYVGSTVYLDRKYTKYLEFLKSYCPINRKAYPTGG